MIDGLAVIDKPPAMTSHDVVARCRRVFGQKRVGHAGTLDPDATGVLLVGLGRVTRLMQFISGLPKSYEALVVLGVATHTLDGSGAVTGRWDLRGVTVEEARAAASSLTGAIWQVPPMVSAVKVGGRRLHEMARRGVEVDRPARRVTVGRFDVEAATDVEAGGLGPGEGPVLKVRVDCSSGTYVRVLAADLGAALGGGAHLRRLRRTRVGPWGVEVAVELDSVDPSRVLSPFESLPWIQPVVVDAEVAEEVAHGRVLDAARIGVDGEGPWRVASASRELLAVYERHGSERVKPMVVLAPGAGSRSLPPTEIDTGDAAGVAGHAVTGPRLDEPPTR